MALQYSVAVRNARLDALETAVGTSPKLRFYTGSPPANCAAAPSGTLLAELTLPSDWMAAASGGSKLMSGTWSGAASVGGLIGHFRLMDSAGTTCHLQGTCGQGTGDMPFDNATVTATQAMQITLFTLTGGNV